MQYLKKEINKILPLAMLCGALGGILLIVVNNLLEPGKLAVVLSYVLVIGVSVYILNKMRYKKEVIGSIIYGYIVYSVMTLIAYIDLLMNTKPDIHNPLFDQVWFFITVFIGVMFLSGAIVFLFKRKVIS